MALIKKQDLVKMNAQDITAKIKELKFELARSHVTAHRATSKTKEIKRTVARLMTRRASTIREAPQK